MDFAPIAVKHYSYMVYIALPITLAINADITDGIVFLYSPLLS